MRKFLTHSWLFLVILVLLACKSTGLIRSAASRPAPEGLAFTHPERVTIHGYGNDAMEPFLTRDGRYLFFNNSNAPSVNTDLKYAERIDDLNFQYMGDIQGVNTASLDAVPSMDIQGLFYLVSTRSYVDTHSTIYRGQFADGGVSNVGLVLGISRNELGSINFDAEISPDGTTLYFVDGHFGAGAIPETADLVVAGKYGIGFKRMDNSASLLEKINTTALEYAPAVSANGLELFFTRLDVKGSSAEPEIFWAWRSSPDEPFELPIRVTAIDGFAEAPSLSLDGASLYYHKKENGHFTIYRVSRKQ